MNRKSGTLNTQSEEDLEQTNPFIGKNKPAPNGRKQSTFHRQPIRRSSGISHRDRMKRSDESIQKVPVEHNSPSIVTISDDEEKSGGSNNQGGTGKEQVTPRRDNRSIQQPSSYSTNRHISYKSNDGKEKTSSRQDKKQLLVHSSNKQPILHRPSLATNRFISPPSDTKVDTISLSSKSHQIKHDNSSLSYSTKSTISSLSTYSLGSESTIEPQSTLPAKNIESSSTRFINDSFSSDDDNDDNTTPPYIKEVLSNSTPVRPSSPLQHPPIYTKLKHLGITSSSPSSSDTSREFSKLGKTMERPNDCHGDINKQGTSDTKLNNSNGLGSKIKNDTDFRLNGNYGDMNIKIKKDTSFRLNGNNGNKNIKIKKDTKTGNTRLNNYDSLDTILGKGTYDREYDDDSEPENNYKRQRVNRMGQSVFSPSHHKSENNSQDSTQSMAVRRSARQQARYTFPQYMESNSSDEDDGIGSSRKYKKREPRMARKPRMERAPSLVELSDDEMMEQNNTVLFTYPVDRSKGSVTITQNDQSRLEPDQFLNDSVIDFYLKWKMDSYSGINGHDIPSTIRQQTAKDTHIFSTLFYIRLTREKGPILYDDVRKWTSDIDLFSKKYAIFPINENWHWYLVLVYNVDRCVSGTRDISDDLETDVDRPMIFILDSLGGRKRKCVQDLIEYLTLEAKSRRGIESSEFIAPTFESANVPKQPNTCDCGVFLLHFVDQFLNSPQDFIDTLLVKDAQHEIWKEGEIEQKRSEIQKLFVKVEQQYSLVNKN